MFILIDLEDEYVKNHNLKAINCNFCKPIKDIKYQKCKTVGKIQSVK